MDQREWTRDNAEHSVLHHLLETDDTFYRTVSKYLTRLAAGIGVPQSEVEDVLGETWLEAVKMRHHFTSDGDNRRRLVNWLAKVVRGKAVDALRRLNKHRCESLGTGEEEPIADKEQKQAETAEKIEKLNALLARLQSVDPENCWLACQRHLKRKTIRELAGKTGRSANEVRCRIYRGMERMRSWASASDSLFVTAS